MTGLIDQRECQVCGARIPSGGGAAECPSCGAPLHPGGPAGEGLTALQRQNIEKTVTGMNDTLMAAGAKNAESAFNLGCGLSLFLVIGSGILVYFLAGRNWILVIITLIMATLAALWAIILVSDLSKTGAIRRTFRKTIEPQINNLASDQRIHREQFDRIAHQSLPVSAPLRLQIPPLPEPEQDEETDALK